MMNPEKDTLTAMLKKWQKIQRPPKSLLVAKVLKTLLIRLSQ
jgi:hypothetical protein